MSKNTTTPPTTSATTKQAKWNIAIGVIAGVAMIGSLIACVPRMLSNLEAIQIANAGTPPDPAMGAVVSVGAAVVGFAILLLLFRND